MGVAALILMNSTHHASATDEQNKDPNNLNEAIASQFNDNIRDVAARLQETEKKMASLELQNKALKDQQSTEVKTENNIGLTKELDALKEQIAELKSSHQPAQEEYSYSISGESKIKTGKVCLS